MKYLLILLLIGCSSTKKLERKQSEALNTVLASKPLLDKAGKQWSELNPCINDTTTITKKDTVTTIQFDSVYFSNDSIVSVPTRIIVKTKIMNIRDTVKYTIEDRRAISVLNNEILLLNDSSHYYNSSYQSLKASEKRLGYCLLLLIRKWQIWILVLGILIYLFRHRIFAAIVKT